MLTIAWITNRRVCMYEWFADSLRNETGGDYSGIKVVVVDFHAEEDGRADEFRRLSHCPILHVPPKPNVWNGKYRLAKEDYFAASNARNTALCHAEDGFIVFVDDLSVVKPGWLAEVRRAEAEQYVCCGAYWKVGQLVVENGQVMSSDNSVSGLDHRYRMTVGDDPVPCGGAWLFGCSVGMPVEWLLDVNGFDEACDSGGFEDCILGLMLERAGRPLKFCKRMLTIESEELHHDGSSFKKIGKPFPGHQDSNWALLHWVTTGKRDTAPNFNNMRELRQKILAGEPFPETRGPIWDWRDGQWIGEM